MGNLIPKQQKRKTTTRNCNCKYRISIRSYGHRDQMIWKIVLDADNQYHNHQLDEDLRGYAIIRRLTQEQECLVRSMHMAGIFTRYILVALQQTFPDCLASCKDIT